MKGAAELHRALARIPEAVRQEVHEELDKQAAAMVADMRALAPVDKGDLRDSINYTFVHRARVLIFAGNAKTQNPAPAEIFVEYGAKNAPAQPFFLPVYRAHKSALKAALSRAVTRAVKNRKP